MPDNLQTLAPTAMTYLTTYLLHSTLLLVAVWLVVRSLRIQSHALAERLWKLAAVAGLFTTPLQLSLGLSSPLCSIPLDYPATAHQSSQLPLDFPVESPVDRLHLHEPTAPPKPSNGSPAMLSQRPQSSPDPQMAQISDDEDSNTRVRATGRRTEETSFQTGENRGDGNSSVPSVDSRSNQTVHSGSIHSAAQPKVRPSVGGPSVGGPSVPALMKGPETVLVSLIALFVIAGLLRLVSQTIRFQRRLVRCRRIDRGPVRDLLNDLLQEASIRRHVTLLVSSQDAEPAAFGLFRWRIVVPEGLEGKLTDAETKALLAHEVAHLVRGDTLWLWIGRWLCSLFAFQPLHFLARREWQRAAEFQCDDWAARHVGDSLALARCLTLVAEWRLHRRVCPATLAAGGSNSNLTSRVERLIEDTDRHDPWTTGFRRRLSALLVLVVLCTLALWGPRTMLLAESTNDADGRQPIAQETRNRRPIDSNAERPHAIRPANPVDAVYKPDTAARPVLAVEDELRALNRELNFLADEMHELNRKLSRSPDRPDLWHLAERLRSRMEQLQRLRNVLSDFQKSNVAERDVEP
jgi:beta-lactamase regulating signal transducer with metallopeptidase domain